jgi:non-ribosomal peptide synthetase component F
VRRAALDAFAHQRLPFDRLVDALVAEREPGVNPIFQVMFAFQNVPANQGPTRWSSELTVTPALITPARARFDLTLYLEPDGDSLNATWLFDRDLFESSTIERASARFLTLAGELANRPNEPLRSGPWHRVCPHARRAWLGPRLRRSHDARLAARGKTRA